MRRGLLACLLTLAALAAVAQEVGRAKGSLVVVGGGRDLDADAEQLWALLDHGDQIYDRGRKLDSGGRFYFLAPGDRYNLKTREAERPQTRGAPLGRVVKQPWPES